MQKRILAIGLNYKKSEHELGGCESDAAEITERAVHGKFEAHERAGVYGAEKFYADIRALKALARSNDLTMIMVSGHGTQVPGTREADGWQGGLCFWNGRNIEVVPETDFLKAVGEIPGSVVIYLDVCFAGEMAGTERAAGIPRKAKFAPFADGFEIVYKRISAFEPRQQGSAKTYKIFACQAGEVSWDTGSAGLFTQSFCAAYDKMPPKRRTIKNILSVAGAICSPDQNPFYTASKGANGTKRLF